MNRQEHLEWCKQRALQILSEGDIQGAYASFMSDMKNHPETENHSALDLGFMLMVGGHLDSAKQMKDFIEGFN